MAIGRLYYTVLSLALCTWYCHSHYEADYPSRGWKPWSGWQNRWQRENEDRAEEEARAQAKKEKLHAARQAALSLELEAEEIAHDEEERIARHLRRLKRHGAHTTAGDSRRHAVAAAGHHRARVPEHVQYRSAAPRQEAPLKPIQRWR